MLKKVVGVQVASQTLCSKWLKTTHCTHSDQFTVTATSFV